jgi:hypothetical protein
MNKKNEKKTQNYQTGKKSDSNIDLSIDSNEDLLSAIKQVANEMATSVIKTNKVAEFIKYETEKSVKQNSSLKRLIEDFNTTKSVQKILREEVKEPKENKEYFILDGPVRSESQKMPIETAAPNAPIKPKEAQQVKTSDYEYNPTKEDIQEEEDEDTDDFNLDISPYLKYEDYNEDEYKNEMDRVPSKKSFYERNIDSYNKTQQRLEIQRNKKIMEEMKYIREKPEISKTSQNIIETKLTDYAPIYDRIDEEIFKKNQRLEFLKFSLADMERMKESQNFSRFNTGVADQEQINNFIETQNEWKRRRDEKIANLKNDIGKIEDEASKYLFQPMILKSSEMIAKNKQKNDKEKKVFNRLYNLHEANLKKKKRMEIKSLPSFKPNINQTGPKYKKKEEDLGSDINKDNKNNEENNYLDSLWDEVGNKQAVNSQNKLKDDHLYSHFKNYYNSSDDDNINSNNNKNIDIFNNNYKQNNYYSNINVNNNHRYRFEENPDEIKNNLNPEINTLKSNLYNNKNFGDFNSNPSQKSINNKEHKNITINDWPDGLNNLYKLNINDKNDNKIIATPQFAAMLKKNFKVIANAKMKYS